MALKGGLADPRTTVIDAAISELADIEAQASRLTEPEQPEKPVWDKPEYDGAFYLAGQYRGPYDQGGVVVQRGSRYYLIEDAQEPDNHVSYLNGYVEDTGNTVTLDIGRDGREASVLQLSDRESYLDDLREHKANVRIASQEYAAAKKAYPAALAEFAEAKRTYAHTQSALEHRRAEVTRKRDRLIAELAVATAAGSRDSSHDASPPPEPPVTAAVPPPEQPVTAAVASPPSQEAGLLVAPAVASGTATSSAGAGIPVSREGASARQRRRRGLAAPPHPAAAGAESGGAEAPTTGSRGVAETTKADDDLGF